MSDESERFRMRARECRQLAARANTTYWHDKLIEIAGELEQEADNIERMERRLNKLNIPPEA